MSTSFPVSGHLSCTIAMTPIYASGVIPEHWPRREMPSLRSMPEEPHHRYKASLRVSSRTLSSAELTRELGKPTRSHDAGDPVTRRRPDAPKRDRALWLLGSGVEQTAPLDQHIAAVLDFVDAHREGLDAIRDQCEIDIFCGIFSGGGQGGFTLEPDLSRRIAQAGLAVIFDIY